MPILWLYALQTYSRIFLLSTASFVAVLIVARFKDIARFTALSADFGKTALFVLYHIPTILPIAIPISSLIASFLIFQNLSRSYELIAMRASGIRLGKILSPFFAAAFFLSLINFLICAEISPYCRREGKALLYHETTSNPLVLLQRQKLLKIKNAYLNMESKNDEIAKNFTLIVRNEATNRLNFISSPKLWIEKEHLIGKNVSIISYLNSEKNKDSMLLENQKLMATEASLLSKSLKKNRPRLDINAINLKMLSLSKKKQGALIEILRRSSLSLAVFSFTLLGAAFGIDEGRYLRKKNLIYALLLVIAVFVSYFLAKGLKNSPFLATLTYLFAHPLIWFFSTLRLYRISRGIAC